MWQIIKNEWKFLLRGKILLSVSAVFLLVLIVSAILGAMQNKAQQERYEEAQKHLREKWESIEEMHPHGAAHYGTYVFKPRGLLNGLDEGVKSSTGNVLRVEGHVQNEMMHSEASQMPVVSKFGKLKSALILQYLLPLLLIFMAFHTIFSERESGRLRLLIVQGTKSSNLIWAKTLAIWSYSLVLLIITITGYSLLNKSSLTNEIVYRAILFFVSYSLYYFIICGLTIFLSISFKNSNLALTSMLGVWILWTIFLPSIYMGSVEKWHELPSREEFKSAMKEDRSKGLDGHNPADERKKELEAKILAEYEVDSISELPINFDGIVMQEDEEYGNKVWDKHFGELNQVLNQQKKKYQYGGIVNPYISLQNASMGFAASDNQHHQDFMLQVERYRRVFIKTLNDEHAFGGSTTGDWSAKANNDFFKSVDDFTYSPPLLVDVLGKYLIDLGLLSVWSLLIAFGLNYGSIKMEAL